MRTCKRLSTALGLAVVTLWVCAAVVSAEPKEKKPAKDAAATAKETRPLAPAQKLSQQEQRIAEKYKHLEDVLLRMVELTATTDPRRAALLRKAVAQSKDQLIGVRFEELTKMLEKDQTSRALENQTELDQDLRALLELLLSENRVRNIAKQKELVTKWLQEVNKLIHQEEDIEGRTTGGDDHKRLADEQGKVAQKTAGLAGEIQKTEAPSAGGAGSRAGKKKQADKDGAKGKGDEGKAKDGKGKDGKDKKDDKAQGKDAKEAKGDKAEGGKAGGQNKQGEQGGKKAQGQGANPPDSKKPDNKKDDGDKGGGKSGSKAPNGQQGQQGEGSQGQNEQQQDGQQDESQSNPARKRLQAAQQRMQEAEKKLKEAERRGAAEDEEKALEELRAAKAELEEILRQLREEQIGHLLKMLEARFRKMLQMQEEVYDGTVRLDKVPPAERTHNHEIESSRLSGKESQIVVEVDKAALLLREEGSAVAFPEAIDQMRDDMQQVVERLAQAKVGKVTQGIEEDILAALKEMIEALKKAQKELGKKKPQGQNGAGMPQEPPLIDVLAELRMIRALQIRVNARTARYSRMIEGDEAPQNAELVEAIRRLAEREQRIHRVTRDLQLGRNQ